jgi:hypothetical protein
MNIIRKGQIEGAGKGGIQGQVRSIGPGSRIERLPGQFHEDYYRSAIQVLLATFYLMVNESRKGGPPAVVAAVTRTGLLPVPAPRSRIIWAVLQVE